MINKMKTRTGGYKNGVANSAKYLLKTEPEGDSIDCSIERLEGESDQAYVNRIEKIFESARVPNQKNLYQHNALAFHPTDGEKLTDAQMIDIAKEVYLKNGLGENRHYLFVVERNTEHPHVHALLHLTDLDTNRVNNKFVKYNPILEKMENKHGLYNAHRMPTPENTAPSNERKTEKDLKKEFKSELKTILDSALTASEFLMLANGAGFDIHHSAKEAYSLTKDDQTFKASDLGMSYKTLKAALGDDPEFSATLALLHKDKAGNDDFSSIGGDFHDEQSSITEKRIKKSNRVLDTRFDTTDGHDYFFKNSKKKAFEYSNGCATFNSTSPMAIKAGLQKLTENNKPQTLHLNGNDDFKRNAWLQFQMMGLEQKGYSLSGFTPTSNDKAQLEKMKLEKPAFKKPIETNGVTALPFETPGDLLAKNLAIKLPSEKESLNPLADPKAKSYLPETSGDESTASKASKSGAAGLLDGLVKALDVFEKHDAKGPMHEMLSQQRVLEAEIKEMRNKSENENHESKKSRLQKLKPQ